jgi:hypothetical protein
LVKTVMIGGVRDKLGGQSCQLSWHAAIRQDARGDYDMVGYNHVVLSERNFKSVIHGFNIRHRYITHVGHQVLDVPGGVVNESFYWYPGSVVHTGNLLGPAVVFKEKSWLRAGQIQTVWLRSHVHACGRVIEPGIHSAARDQMVDPSRAKMGGDRQTVRPRTDNEHLTSPHVTLLMGGCTYRCYGQY